MHLKLLSYKETARAKYTNSRNPNNNFTPQQKNGFAKEGLLGILNFLFTELNIHRVFEVVDAENIASINLLKSIGFKEEGHFVENIFFKGSWGSEFQYALLKREWDTTNS